MPAPPSAKTRHVFPVAKAVFPAADDKRLSFNKGNCQFFPRVIIYLLHGGARDIHISAALLLGEALFIYKPHGLVFIHCHNDGVFLAKSRTHRSKFGIPRHTAYSSPFFRSRHRFSLLNTGVGASTFSTIFHRWPRFSFETPRGAPKVPLSSIKNLLCTIRLFGLCRTYRAPCSAHGDLPVCHDTPPRRIARHGPFHTFSA